MSEMTEREYERMLDTFNTASEWHGGQWSALYSYASTGKIHGPEHRADLLDEIEQCEASLRAQTAAYGYSALTRALEEAALDHLRRTVEAWPDEAI